MTAMTEAQVFGIRWRPLYKAKLAPRGALSAMAEGVNELTVTHKYGSMQA